MTPEHTSARAGRPRPRRWMRTLPGLALLSGAALFAIYLLRPDWLLEAEFARQRWFAGVTRHDVVVDDHRWTFLERSPREGGSADTWVLVHGFTGSKENWLPMVGALDDAASVLAPDLPGWGESTRIADADYGILAQVDRLEKFLHTQQLARVHLVGHSMGGHIVGVFAARHPQRVASLSLVDSAGVIFEPNDFALRVQRGEMPFNFSNRAEFDAFMAVMFSNPPFLPSRLKDVLIARNVAGHAFHARVLDAISKGDAAFELQRNLPRIRADTLVLWCRDDRVLDVTSVRAFALMSAPPTVNVLEGCGHMAMMERPVEVANALRALAVQSR